MKLTWIKWWLLAGACCFAIVGWSLLPTPSPYVGNPNLGPMCVYTMECPQFFRFFTVTNATFAASIITAFITVWAFIIDRRVKLKAEERDAQRFAWEVEDRVPNTKENNEGRKVELE